MTIQVILSVRDNPFSRLHLIPKTTKFRYIYLAAECAEYSSANSKKTF
jgi:hypothetical protein